MPKSLLRAAMLLVGMTATVLIAGCRNPFAASPPGALTQPRTTTPAEQTGAPNTAPTDAEGQVKGVVADYLADLTDGKYAAAYDLLSSESQSAHSRANFEQTGKKGMPLYDLKTARVSIDGDSATVELRQLEDPATHGFQLTRESGSWKIVYRGGIPGQPTP